MSSRDYVTRYAIRLLIREWPRYVLAALSLIITSLTLTVVLVGANGARSYISDRTREFAGGDFSLQSNFPFSPDPLMASLRFAILAEGQETELLLAVRSATAVLGVSARAVSADFPLYGTVRLAEGTYRFPRADEVYLDQAALDRLTLTPGGTLFIGEIPYHVVGSIVEEPDALLAGFRFAPRMLLSQEGLARAAINLAESRSEYTYRYRLQEDTPATMIEAVVDTAKQRGIRARVTGQGGEGFLRRLENVERYFLVAVLIGAILAAVNVYANTLTLVRRLRKSFAVLLVEGATQRALVRLVLTIICLVALLASCVGIGLGIGAVQLLTGYILDKTELLLPLAIGPLTLLIIAGGTITTSLTAALPAVRDLFTLSPRVLLSGEEHTRSPLRSARALITTSVLSFLPLFILAWYFLQSVRLALNVVGLTLAAYVGVACAVAVLLRVVYRKRARLSFFFRTIVAEKRADGLFGVIATASLFTALTGIFTLALLETSIQQFFQSGIRETLPSAYVIDIQKDQMTTVRASAPDVVLFPNVRGRILRIDDRNIEERLRAESGQEERELGREFNLTYRTELLASETVTAGEFQGSRTAEVSVEEEFATRANIALGSEVEFLIQGVPLSATVTSLRRADTTSGLPFFYFVFSPESLSSFPASYFGYLYADGAAIRRLEATLALEAPNITVLDTTRVGEQVRALSATVIAVVSVVTLPPLLLATVLLFSLVASTFVGRKRDAVRLRVLGATEQSTARLYLVETASTVVIAGLGAAVLAALVVKLLTLTIFEGITPVLLDQRIFLISGALVGALLLYATTLLMFRKRPLREELSYEENR